MVEVILLHIQNSAGICQQITIIILYQIKSILVTLVKFHYASIQVSIVFLTVCSNSLILSFRQSPSVFINFAMREHSTTDKYLHVENLLR